MPRNIVLQYFVVDILVAKEMGGAFRISLSDELLDP